MALKRQNNNNNKKKKRNTTKSLPIDGEETLPGEPEVKLCTENEEEQKEKRQQFRDEKL